MGLGKYNFSKLILPPRITTCHVYKPKKLKNPDVASGPAFSQQTPNGESLFIVFLNASKMPGSSPIPNFLAHSGRLLLSVWSGRFRCAELGCPARKARRSWHTLPENRKQ